MSMILFRFLVTTCNTRVREHYLIVFMHMKTHEHVSADDTVDIIALSTVHNYDE